MTEQFLQYIWKFGLFDRSGLITDSGEEITIVKIGKLNSNAGPDFLNARLKISDTTWAGNVEMHLNSSDWYKHNHHVDEAYNNVILQVVQNNDQPVFLQNGEKLPTLELKFDQRFYENYQALIQTKKWVSCEEKIRKLDRFMINCWLESLMVERLCMKSSLIEDTLSRLNYDWSETFYIYLAKNFGFNVNGEPFEMLARSLNLKNLSKQKDSLLQIEAMLFGQAGFLGEAERDDYYMALKKEYTFLKKKYGLKPLDKYIWKFLRLRPDNFPTIRIAQLATLIYQSSFLFSRILGTEKIDEIINLFSVSASEYWNDHYQFGKKLPKKRIKKIGKESITSFVINTISPFLFLYGKINGKEEIKERAVLILSALQPEKNSVTAGWANIGIKADNAAQSQALLHLKKHYCDPKNCLSCMFGNKFITSV
jgi:hypothetical protein